MNFDKYIVWGYRNEKTYDTYRHINEGFYRALRHLGKNVRWLDESDDTSRVDFSNAFIISNHSCVQREGAYWPWEEVERKSMLPIRDDCFYAIHGLHDNQAVSDLFRNHKWNVSWNVLTMRAMRHFLNLPVLSKMTNEVWIQEDTPFSLEQRYMEFRWATNLLPYEIEANKPTELLSLKNRVVNWVGTVWYVNELELSKFIDACKQDNVEFKHIGGGQVGVVSSEENVKLIRESWMAPAISGSHHLTEGYVPCRIFKNISYGQFGITNNPKTNELFGGKLIYNENPYHLYYEAKERLQSTKVEELHELMDIVAEKHTYLNRLEGLFKAAQMIMQ